MVYLAGSATTKFGEAFNVSLLDLMEEAIVEALHDSQSPLTDIEAIYVSNMLSGSLQNIQHLGSQLAGRLKVNKPIYFYEAACASGGMALHHAWKDLKGCHYRKVLVVGGEKMTDLGADVVNGLLNRAASEAEQISGISFAGLYALMTQAYLAEHQQSIDDLAYASALMHHHGATRPNAHFYQKTFAPEAVQQARLIAEPLNLLHCSPLSDGAAALVLQSEPSAVELTGSSVATDTPGLAERATLTSISATQTALKRLGTDAEWVQNCEVIEIHDCFSIALVIALEDLGIAEPGMGMQFLKDLWESSQIGGYRPRLNISGGLKAGGHPVGATGVKQAHTIYQHLKSADPGATGLSHNIGGTGGTAALHSFARC